MAIDRSTAKRVLRLAIAFAVLVKQAGGRPRPGYIVGTWLTETRSKVEVVAGKAADGSAIYSGTVSWLKDPRLMASRCTMPATTTSRCSRPIMGSRSVRIQFYRPATRTGGQLYAPRNGRASAVLTLTPDGRLGEGQRRRRQEDHVLDALSYRTSA
jgi:hypothetical protein